MVTVEDMSFCGWSVFCSLGADYIFSMPGVRRRRVVVPFHHRGLAKARDIRLAIAHIGA